MLQKRNDLEIVELLRKEPKHIRKIAEELSLIPSTAMRIINNLAKENVVDYKTEGKNKVYFLKNVPEARSYLYMTEYYKQIKLLENPLMRTIINQLQKKTNGELIVLFGSYAKNTTTKHSDVDIYIETQSRKQKDELRLISEKLSIKIGKLHKENLLTQEIIKNHVIIQNVERFYQAIK